MIPIYSCSDKYLYEIIEDYKDTNSDNKNDIFHSFCSVIWSCRNKRRTYNKTINYNVSKDSRNTGLGKIFYTWSVLEYKYYKSMSKDNNWYSIIRQKINNIYTRYFDKEVILEKEYIDLLKTPKRLYYEWISGAEMDPDIVTESIDDAINKSKDVKQQLQMRKMNLSWNDYQKVIEGFLHRCFENSKLIEEYEDKTVIASRFDFLTEDHFYIKYINRCLDGEIRKWQKRYYHLPQNTRKKYNRCVDCNGLYIQQTNNQKRCKECQTIRNRKNKTEKQRKYRVEKQKSKEKPRYHR